MFEFLKGKKKKDEEKSSELPEELEKEESKDKERHDMPSEFVDEEVEKEELAPVLPLPTDEEAKMAPISPPSKPILTKKGMKGPVFVSFRKYQDVKGNLEGLKDNAIELKMIIDDLKINKGTGSELLKELTENLEKIENRINKINSTLRA